MAYRKLIAGISLGSFAVLGGLAAAPADEAENGCRGINQARDTEAYDTPAGAVLNTVAELISDDGCAEDDKASDAGGDNGKRP
jgi:hypothetical protein